MSNPFLRISIAAPAIVFVAAVGLQRANFFREVPRPRELRLAQDVPSSLPGWDGRDLPIGANEYISSEAEKVLNFDQVVYREFERGGEKFGVYVAYWGPGKMPTRLVASHTPDRCWTENGWKCLRMRFRQAESVNGAPLQPAEWREFEPPDGGKPTYVLYWHLVEGHIYDYGNRFNEVPDPMLWWKDAIRQALLGSREQFFIRLTSNVPLEHLWSDPGFSRVVQSLARLGVAATPQGKANS